jgi:hypothetical protein
MSTRLVYAIAQIETSPALLSVLRSLWTESGKKMNRASDPLTIALNSTVSPNGLFSGDASSE